MANDKMIPTGGEVLIYQAEDGQVKIDVRLRQETLWMTQADMAQLFQTSKQNIGQHLKNIFSEGELDPDSAVKKFFTTATDGKKYQTNFYNLDAIISVGYRVKSLVATRFRIWATKQLTEYIVKGFVMDDERLKNPPVDDSGAPDYFDEMLERIRDIRASERRMYLRVREIFKMADDYQPSHPDTNHFFSIIQNKLHFAATGMTAPELIRSRTDHRLPNMGLTSWNKQEIRKTDVTVAKNYLTENEISELNRIVVMWLDYAEDQAKRRQKVFLRDWKEKLDGFLRFNDRNVLPNAGTMTKKEAADYAKNEYDLFAEQRRHDKEAVAEADYMNQLEEAAKIIPSQHGDKGGSHGKA
ncbi:MAG: virulence RhuM family protein [Desulfoplanes sp.]|nr:virulence RhuM family protein [Desulfoplanes sp.]